MCCGWSEIWRSRLLQITDHPEQNLYKTNHPNFRFTKLTTLIQHTSGEHSRKHFFQPRLTYGRTVRRQGVVFAPATGEHVCAVVTWPAQSRAATCPFNHTKPPQPLFFFFILRHQPQFTHTLHTHCTHIASFNLEKKVWSGQRKGEKGRLLCYFHRIN